MQKFDTDCELRLIDSNDLGKFYRYVNNKIVNKTGIGAIKSSTGNILHSDIDKAECFNEFFSSVFTADNGILPPVTSKAPPDSLVDVSFTYGDVVRAVRHLKCKTSLGPNGLSFVFIKSLSDGIAFPLMLISAQSRQSSTVPEIWKTAVVTPVHKKGLTSDVNNYRPISLTCICCKLMETIIKQKMLDYLLSSNLISKHQHGFLSKRSTCSQLLECVDDWTLALHNRYSVDVVYVDFSKAFDSVGHSKLLHKLESFGIGGKLLLWIRDYLYNRTQCVKVGNCF